MNTYRNKFGFHTPERSEENKNKLELATGLKFEDSSWHNDTCDSLINEDIHIQVYLPNSDEQNIYQEQFKYYAITIDGSEKMDGSHYDCPFEEVVTIINKLKK
tara:strand:+ start:1241 stop:1549 length:309 start_codon:yes stop_codon:yes gene_type:complete